MRLIAVPGQVDPRDENEWTDHVRSLVDKLESTTAAAAAAVNGRAAQPAAS